MDSAGQASKSSKNPISRGTSGRLSQGGQGVFADFVGASQNNGTLIKIPTTKVDPGTHSRDVAVGADAQ